MKTIQIDVALVDGTNMTNAGWKVPYDQRPIVSRMVEPHATLESVLVWARSEFEAEFSVVTFQDAGATLDFFHGDDNEIVEPKYMQARGVTVVRSDGLARWNVPPAEASIGEMVSAKEAGVFVGEPQKPYWNDPLRWYQFGVEDL